MALPQYSNVTVDVTTNEALGGATVVVYETGTQILADLFEDAGGLTPMANPFTSDARTGQYTFFTDPGAYDLTVTKPGATSYTLSNVSIATTVGAVLQQGGVTAGHSVLWAGNQLIEDGGSPLVIGTTAGTACEGDDARLSDQRTPLDASVTIAKFAATVAPIQTIQIVLTDAQIKALPTTPVQIIPAASSRFLKLLAVTYESNLAAPYTGFNATYADLHIQSAVGGYYYSYGPVADSTNSPAVTLLTDLLSITGIRLYEVAQPPLTAIGAVVGGDGYVQNATIVDNSVFGKSASIAIDNSGSGNLTGGNALNTLTVTIQYLLIPV